jgi:hypothetical protein
LVECGDWNRGGEGEVAGFAVEMVVFAGVERAAAEFDAGDGVELLEKGLLGFEEGVGGEGYDSCEEEGEISQDWHRD